MSRLIGATRSKILTKAVHWVIHAYGEDRLHLIYNLCEGNLKSACPLESRDPIEASFNITLASAQARGIQFIAQGQPDLDGYARLSIFSSPMSKEVGCVQAALTTGHTLSHPRYIGLALVILTIVASVASFATTIYGVSTEHIRIHYAHSISVLGILEAFQSIFLTGAISVEWPAVLLAWWSNFACSVGVVSNPAMVRVLSNSTGVFGHRSVTGESLSTNITHGVDISQQIYEGLTDGSSNNIAPIIRQPSFVSIDNATYIWGGSASTPGLTLPGKWPGLAGTLSKLEVPAPTVAMLSLIWLLTTLATAVALVCLVKALLELGAKVDLIRTDGFDLFRKRWLCYCTAVVMRILSVAFFPLVIFSCFQLSLRAHPGPTTVSTLLLLLLVGFLGGLAAYAFYRLSSTSPVDSDAIKMQDIEFAEIPGPSNATTAPIETGQAENNAEAPRPQGKPTSAPKETVMSISESRNIHSDGSVRCFGWIYGRWRSTRWWFFTFSLMFRFLQACFLGGASGSPKIQISGVLTLNTLYLMLLVTLIPFEGNRNQAIAIMTCLSNIVSTSLTIGLLPQVGLDILYVQIIGFIIAIVQAFLTLAVLILIAAGVVSTCFSLSRNRECSGAKWDQPRVLYFEHVEKTSQGRLEVDDSVVALQTRPSTGGDAAVEEAGQGEPAEEGPVKDILNANQSKASSHAHSHDSVASTLSHGHSIHECVPMGPRNMPVGVERRPRSLYIPKRSWGDELKLRDAASLKAEGQRMDRRRSNSLRTKARSTYRNSTDSETTPFGPPSDDLDAIYGEGSGSEDSQHSMDTLKFDDSQPEPAAEATAPADEPPRHERQDLLSVPVDETVANEARLNMRRSSYFNEFKSHCHVITEEDEGDDAGAFVDETVRKTPLGPRPLPSPGIRLAVVKEEDEKSEDELDGDASKRKTLKGPRPLPSADAPIIIVSKSSEGKGDTD